MAIDCLRKWTDPSTKTKFAAAGVMALEARVGVGAPGGPVGRPEAAGGVTVQRGRVVDRHGRAVGVGAVLPDVVVGALGGEGLAGRDRVARPVGDAGQLDDLVRRAVEHPAEGRRGTPSGGGWR